ncbi:MAG: hypothetical protein OHK0013_08220 [Sandaracinaceae bacterium]
MDGRESSLPRAAATLLACLTVLTTLLALVLPPRSAEAQRRRALRARRVIVLDEMHCDWDAWRTPMLVLVLTMPACPEDDLIAACGATPTPRSACWEPSAADVEALARCTPSRETFLGLLRVVEQRAGLPPWLAPLLTRLASESGLDEVQRTLIAELLRKQARYDEAVARFAALADDARDPALRALALERLVEVLQYEDWNEDGLTDDDFATHFAPPRLPDRPWAREVAVRALSRVGCLGPHAVALGAIRRRFDFDPEGVIAIDHAQTLTGADLRDHLQASVARCRRERAPCAERLLDHAQNEVRGGLHACGRLERGAEAHHAERCREALALAAWLATERPLPTLASDVAAASVRLAWWSSADPAQPRAAPPTVTITTPSAHPPTAESAGAYDRVLARLHLTRLPLAACPPPAAAALVLLQIDEAGQARVGTNAVDPCLRSALASFPALTPGAQGGIWQGEAVLVFPER